MDLPTSCTQVLIFVLFDSCFIRQGFLGICQSGTTYIWQYETNNWTYHAIDALLSNLLSLSFLSFLHVLHSISWNA